MFFEASAKCNVDSNLIIIPLEKTIHENNVVLDRFDLFFYFR